MARNRDILIPVLGADALAEAERRVYDRPSADLTRPRYACADDRCAVGVMVRVAGITLRHGESANFPPASAVIEATIATTALYEEWRQPHIAKPLRALQAVIKLNDTGGLATPGRLTAFLDEEVAA